MIVNADPNSAESGAEMLKDFFAQAQESASAFRDAATGRSTLCNGRDGP